MPETPWPLHGLTLRVRDLDRQVAFYTDILGLHASRTEGASVQLAPRDGGFTLTLQHEPDAPRRPYPCLGLYHFALLVPSRPALGAVVRHLLEAKYPMEGFSDHAVSEAAYLSDPEGNGIEIYRDRPDVEWRRGDDGVAMTTKRMDLAGVLAGSPAASGLDPATLLGHVHHHVPTLEEAERFHAQGLGLDVTQRSYPGALFLSRDGYHHHVGANVWAPPRRAPPNATGLVSVAWRVPDADTIAKRLHGLGIHVDESAGRVAAVDPSGARVEIASWARP